MTQQLRAVRSAAPYRPGERAREQLLDAAGIVFAEKGYDRATSREICELAGVNAAAVNYHFGGIDTLYVETLRRAHQGLVSAEERSKIADSGRTAMEKLLAYLGAVVRRVANPAERSWNMRLICREMISPTGLRDQIVSTEIRPSTDFARELIAELIGAGLDEPIVGETMLTVIAPILIMATAALPILDNLTPSTEEAGAKAESLSVHYERFILGGLDAVTTAYWAQLQGEAVRDRGARTARIASASRKLPKRADPDTGRGA